MVNEASDELETIAFDDRMMPEVLAVRVDLYSKAKKWDLMADVAKHLSESYPNQSSGWVHWTYALREQANVTESKDVAL